MNPHHLTKRRRLEGTWGRAVVFLEEEADMGAHANMVAAVVVGVRVAVAVAESCSLQFYS